jgi:hypothetical protein
MKAAALLLVGVAIGWAMKTGGSDAWVAVACAGVTGFLIAVIGLGADLAVRVARRIH